ncbi:MAG: SCO family protein [Candidatus Sericytochromatia bacterium]|nr:SCO family protein [Candidatus Sericytochromatia bacterium]
MASPEPPSSQTDSAGWIDLLPALTLFVIVAIFSLQALKAPLEQARLRQAELAHPALDPERALPLLGQIPDFQLPERSEATVGPTQLRGKVWVADFIFTSCTAECPLMNIEMQKIQKAFADRPELGLLSITVDPAVDTPARLREYADALQADASRWLFLTGEREALHQLAIQGFKLPVQDLAAMQHDAGHHGHHGAEPHDSDKPLSSPFLHSQKFVLLDAELQIRGYYDSTDPEAMRRLIEKDIPALLPAP